LINVGVFRASTVRASIGAYSTNYATAGASLTTANITLAAGQVYTFNISSSSSPSTALVLHTTAALRVDAEFEAFDVTDSSGVTTNARAAGAQVFNVKSLLILDDAITSLVLENVSSTSATVTIHQG
jgi:hypothetical protein